MANKGLLIDYDYCTGCRSCMVACQQENDYPVGKCGIVITDHEMETFEDDKLLIFHIPFITNFCNLCFKRTQAGILPSCVKHCQAICMEYGDVDELAKKMKDKSRMLLYKPLD